MIRIEDVHHTAGRSPILHGIDLEIPERSVTALIGPNGAGKSTLLSLIARLDRLQRGRIEVGGADIGTTPTDQLARKLAILRQDSGLATRLRVRDLVAFGRYPHHKGRPGPEDRKAVDAAIEAFDLERFAGRYTDQLSGGQRQRALVAMTFAQATDYVLLDEPLNNLDMSHASSLMARLRDLAATGRTIVIVLHDVNHAAAHASHVVAMKDGRVAAEGAAGAVLTGPQLSALYDCDVGIGEIDGRRVVLPPV